MRQHSTHARWHAATLSALALVATNLAIGLDVPPAGAAPGDISTVAGGYDRGEGQPATMAILEEPTDIAVLPDGGFVVAERFAGQVRRIHPDGTLTTAAGRYPGHQFTGDGGPAPAAYLNGSEGVSVMADGGLLIADTENNRIRKVSPAGVITTVAGSLLGFQGDGGLAVLARFARPASVAVTPDGGYLIADTENNRIRKVGADGNITTVAGGGPTYPGDGGPATAARLNQPHDVAVTADGGYLIADTFGHRIRKVAADGTISTVAGGDGNGFHGDGGPATAALLSQPYKVTPTADGGFVIADTNNVRIRRVAPDGTIDTVPVAGLGKPMGVAEMSDGSLLVSDADADRVRKVAPGGAVTVVAGSTYPEGGDGLAATLGTLVTPSGVAATPDGGYLIADTFANKVRKVSASGTITTVAGLGTPGSSGDGGLAVVAELDKPWAVAVAPDGSFVIADSGNDRVRKVTPDGLITTLAGTGSGLSDPDDDGGPAAAAALDNPRGIAALADGGVLVSERDASVIRRIAPDGTISTVAGMHYVHDDDGDGGPATDAELASPEQIAGTADGGFVIADGGNGTIREVGPDGIIDAVASGFSLPTGVAVLGNGDLVVADSNGHRVHHVDLPSGTATPLAGTGSAGFNGDEGPATAALLDSPRQLAVTAAGDILVADSDNNRVRKVTASSITPPQGSGSFDGDGRADVFWYGPGADPDSVGYANEARGSFQFKSKPVHGTYVPLSGDFDGDGYTDVFWYGPGNDPDAIWFGTATRGSWVTKNVTVNGTYDPVVGDFDGDGHDDVFWYGPGAAADSIAFGTATRGTFTFKNVTVGGTYTPVAGDFDGDGRTDVFWYGPGADPDVIGYANATRGSFTFKTKAVHGTYTPVAGDFDADGYTDVFWYGPGADPDSIWYGTGTRGGFAYKNVIVAGHYQPVTGDFDADGHTDIFWYGPGPATDSIAYPITGTRGVFQFKHVTVTGTYTPIGSG